MKTRVDLAPQVEEFLRRLAPEPRRALRLALRGLLAEQGDIKALEGELSGFWRLRVGAYRVIYANESCVVFSLSVERSFTRCLPKQSRLFGAEHAEGFERAELSFTGIVRA